MTSLSLGIYTVYFTQYAMLPPPGSHGILCANHIYIFPMAATSLHYLHTLCIIANISGVNRYMLCDILLMRLKFPTKNYIYKQCLYPYIVTTTGELE